MKRRLALLTLLFVLMASLVLMPTLAQQDNDAVGPRGESDKFLRMGKNAIPFSYIVVLDADTDVANRNADFKSPKRL